MLIEKHYIGQIELSHSIIRYFVIQKECYYGVEIVEEVNHKFICSSELFTEIADDALALASKLLSHTVTSTTLTEIIDDYMSV